METLSSGLVFAAFLLGQVPTIIAIDTGGACMIPGHPL